MLLYLFIYLYMDDSSLLRNIHLKILEAPVSHRLVEFDLYGNSLLEGPPILRKCQSFQKLVK